MFWGCESLLWRGELCERPAREERGPTLETNQSGEAFSMIRVQRVRLSLPPPEQASSSDQTTRT